MIKQKELMSIVNEEAKKLGIDPSTIDCEYGMPRAKARKVGNRYELWITAFRDVTKQIRHELYHVYKGDCDKYENKDTSTLRFIMHYLFIMEPRAILYERKAIKL